MLAVALRILFYTPANIKSCLDCKQSLINLVPAAPVNLIASSYLTLLASLFLISES